MPAASFTFGAGTLTFTRAPERPAQSREMLQSEARSTGGTRFGGAIYAADDLIPLRWQGMSSADLVALQGFFFTTIGGMPYTFTYTDTGGVAYTVRLASPEISTTEIAFDRHDVSLTLRKVV